jgi:hypothetical protein
MPRWRRLWCLCRHRSLGLFRFDDMPPIPEYADLPAGTIRPGADHGKHLAVLGSGIPLGQHAVHTAAGRVLDLLRTTSKGVTTFENNRTCHPQVPNSPRTSA